MKRDKFENAIQETGTAFALAVLLLNILIVSAVGGIIWFLQTISTLDGGSLGAILREAAIR